MVCMFVGKEYAVKPLAFAGQHLLPEIRPAVDNIGIIIPMYPYRYTKSLVPGILASANRVIAANNGYSLGSSCS